MKNNDIAKAIELASTVKHTKFELLRTSQGFVCTIYNGKEKWFALDTKPIAAITKAVMLAQ